MEHFWNKRDNISKYYLNINNPDYDKALTLAFQLLEEYPDVAQAYSELASVYHMMKDYDKAIEYETKAIELEPNNASFYHSRADSYFRNEDFYNAIDNSLHVIYNEDLKFRTECLSWAYSYNLILAYLCTNQFDLAKEIFDEHIDDDYVYYTKPIKGRITKQRLKNCIDNRINILYDGV